MNENARTFKLSDFTQSQDCWGRESGRAVYTKLIEFVEQNSGVMMFRVSIEGVRRVDISFASETVVELARRYCGAKGFCFIDLSDRDMIENWDAAAVRKEQPIVSWQETKWSVLGPQPSKGTLEAFKFAMDRGVTRASEFGQAHKVLSLANASMKFRKLSDQGFLLRRDGTAESGGVEFHYHRIG